MEDKLEELGSLYAQDKHNYFEDSLTRDRAIKLVEEINKKKKNRTISK